MSNSAEDISKEIVIALIQRGLFDNVDNVETCSTILTDRTEKICKSYSAIYKNVNDCLDGKYE